MADAPKKMGRPAFNLSDELAAEIIALAEQGSTLDQIAAAVGIGITTLKKLKGQHADFAAALKGAKDIADDLVEGTLFQRAVGGDTTACIFWLKNRRPERWRDVHKIDINGEVKLTLPTPEEARQILAQDYAVLPAVEVKVDDL